MERTEIMEKILFGRAEEGRPGLIERHNNTERIAMGLQARLTQVLFGIAAMIGVQIINTVVLKHNTTQIDALPQVVKPPQPPAE